MRSKDPLADPRQMANIENQFSQQQQILQQMGKENQQLMEALQEKDKEISQWRLLVEEAERRMNKMRSKGKDSKKHKKLL